jgi:uridylate kinase
MPSAPRRILLKLSGEAFKGTEGAFSPAALQRIAGEIALVSSGLAVVVGAGNILRGARSALFDRIEADTLGMLATVLNALALRTYLEAVGRDVFVQSAVSTELTDPVSPRDARRALDQGAIVIFAGGTGSPLVTTDTAAALRAVSVGADLLAKASNVDGLYDRDPAVDPAARLLREVSFDDVLAARYGVMDLVAVEICREHALPIEIFDFAQPGALAAIAKGRHVGTRIHA